jgi:hypothetical protein
MDQSLLNRLCASLVYLSLAGIGLFPFHGCRLFNDAELELDPALKDSTLTALPASAHQSVARLHLLETFGSYGCISCPEAEARLAPYYHGEKPTALYNPKLIVITYHVKFGSIPDPWVTPTIQALNDAKGYVSLPQAILNGSNSPFGIREKDVAFKSGEYDSLVSRLKLISSESWLNITLDKSRIVYDTSAKRIKFPFTVNNQDKVAQAAMDFHILVVKNKPAIIPIYPTPWEVIVMERIDTDAEGKTMTLPALSALTAKTFSVDFTVPDEATKHVRPPPLGSETLSEYALIILAQDRNGTVLNVVTTQYGPKAP